MNTKIFSLLRMALPLAAIAVGHAGVITYSDFASWQAALSSEVNVSVAGIVPSGQTRLIATAPPLLIGQIGLTALSGTVIVVDRQFASPRYLDCDVACMQDVNETNGGIRFFLPAGTNAFAFDNFWPSPGSVSLSVSIGDFTDNATALSEQPAFFGFVSTTPFTSLTISSDKTPNVFDIAYGSTAPEPGGGMLIALGLLCVMAARLVGIAKSERQKDWWIW